LACRRDRPAHAGEIHDRVPVFPGWLAGWLDVAREYMERYAHQQQIRDATGRPVLRAVHPPSPGGCRTCAARALAGVSRPDGTVVTFTADGAGGGRWYVVCQGGDWQLGGSGPPPPPACEVSTTVAGAIKLYTRDPGAQPLVRRGDPALADALSRVKAVLG
jgi:hypothetical protein